MKKALVVGSEGNVGKPLVESLRNSGYEVVSLDIKPGFKEGFHVSDINNPLDLLPAFDTKPDVVFLLSAMVSRVTCEQASSLAIATNLGGVNNVIQLTKRVGAKLVFFSTSEIYGPHLEVMREDEKNLSPNNRYGLSKLLGEQLVEYEVDHYGLKAVTVRPFMMYDEFEALGDHRSAMIRFAYNLAMGMPIQVHDGSSRGWLHVSDAIRAIRASAELDEYAVINIGHPDLRPIAELAEMMRANLGAPHDLITNEKIPTQMTLSKNPTLDRMRDLLGIEPAVSLEEGVERVCNVIRTRLS
ncbi:MAG: NAD(P)-dependent oxidoreductase [Pseudomonadota bacterium]